MATTQHTGHYNLPTFGDNPNDRPSWRGDFTDAMTKIDNQMYANATVKGDMSSMPDTPGLAVWHSGHIGVYIGGGEVIEAMGTKYGVVKTKLSERSWTAWLEIPYINYISESEVTS